MFRVFKNPAPERWNLVLKFEVISFLDEGSAFPLIEFMMKLVAMEKNTPFDSNELTGGIYRQKPESEFFQFLLFKVIEKSYLKIKYLNCLLS